jgi:predicted  nucleic acid-binding Zn-ribbon protein
MSSASQALYDLQEVESQLEAGRAAGSTIERQLRGSPEMDALRKRISSLEAEQKEVETRLRSLERQADDLQVSIKKHTDTLYGGLIHDARELASIEAEIGHDKSRQSEVESEEIELMERAEAIEGDLKSPRQHLTELTGARQEELSRLQTELATNVETIVDLDRRREEMAGKIDPQLLRTYDRLKQRSGHAVSSVDAGVCHWCHVQVPPKDIQHARGPNIVHCNNCGRILYAS